MKPNNVLEKFWAMRLKHHAQCFEHTQSLGYRQPAQVLEPLVRVNTLVLTQTSFPADIKNHSQWMLFEQVDHMENVHRLSVDKLSVGQHWVLDYAHWDGELLQKLNHLLVSLSHDQLSQILVLGPIDPLLRDQLICRGLNYWHEQSFAVEKPSDRLRFVFDIFKAQYHNKFQSFLNSSKSGSILNETPNLKTKQGFWLKPRERQIFNRNFQSIGRLECSVTKSRVRWAVRFDRQQKKSFQITPLEELFRSVDDLKDHFIISTRLNDYEQLLSLTSGASNVLILSNEWVWAHNTTTAEIDTATVQGNNASRVKSLINAGWNIWVLGIERHRYTALFYQLGVQAFIGDKAYFHIEDTIVL